MSKQHQLQLLGLRTQLTALSDQWAAKLTPELRHAAMHSHADSCTRLLSGPGYPVQAALWAIVAKRLAAFPDELSVRAPKRGELTGTEARAEVVVMISHADFAVPLTLSAAVRITEHAAKTLSACLSPDSDPWGGWRSLVVDEQGKPALGPALRTLHRAVEMFAGCLHDFSQHRDVIARRIEYREGAADSWFALVGVVELLQILMPLVEATLPQASRLPESDLPLQRRTRTSMRITLDSLRSMLSGVSLPPRATAPGLVAGHVWHARDVAVDQWVQRATELRDFSAAVAEYGRVPADQPTKRGQAGAKRRWLSTSSSRPPKGNWKPVRWVLEAVHRFNPNSTLDDQELRRLAQSGQLGTPGAWKPKGRFYYDVSKLVPRLTRQPDRDALRKAIADEFTPPRRTRESRQKTRGQ